jgi:predicted Zn-ribbon and HTH transcriptional regulator
MEANSIVEKIETLSPEQAAMLIQILNEDQGVQVVEAAAKVEDLVADVKPMAEKVKCKCCGFAKKARRVNAEGICKVCYMALATSGGESVTVVGRQGKRGRNTVSVVIGGERVKVQRKVRLEA